MGGSEHVGVKEDDVRESQKTRLKGRVIVSTPKGRTLSLESLEDPDYTITLPPRTHTGGKRSIRERLLGLREETVYPYWEDTDGGYRRHY